jgi:hypothetical protein
MRYVDIRPDLEGMAGIAATFKPTVPEGPSRGTAEKPADRLSLGAGEGIRTLDPDLGKVVLYH